MEKIMGLWLNKGKDGNMFLKGKYLGLKVIVLPNLKKEGNQPDFHLFLDVAEPQSGFNEPVVTFQDFLKE